jgi:hypothetical protein
MLNRMKRARDGAPNPPLHTDIEDGRFKREKENADNTTSRLLVVEHGNAISMLLF